MNVDMAKRLADRRRKAGFTQEGLAEKLGVSRQAISKWERSESSPDTDNLIALAELYGVSLDDLLYRSVEEDSRSEEPTTEEATTEAAINECDDSPDATDKRDGDDATNVSENGSRTESSSSAKPSDESESAQNEEPESDKEAAGFGFESNDGTVHIRPDGIHVEDGKDYVHINWRDGVNVIDGKKGDKVHIGWDGIHVNDQSYDDLNAANEALGTHHPGSKYQTPFAKAWARFPFPLLSIIVYLLLGVLGGYWIIGLYVFATIPLYYLIGALIATKKLGPFLAGLYPLIILCWFLYMAFALNEPHPAWAMLLTIPLFDGLVMWVSHWRSKHKDSRTN